MDKSSKKNVQKEISTAVHVILLKYDKASTIKSDKTIKFFTRQLIKKFYKEMKKADKKRRKIVAKKKVSKKSVAKKKVGRAKAAK